MAEYDILIAVATLVVVAAVFLGSSITGLFRDTGSHL
jgi:Flp pilus assembly pilin Flp